MILLNDIIFAVPSYNSRFDVEPAFYTIVCMAFPILLMYYLNHRENKRASGL